MITQVANFIGTDSDYDSAMRLRLSSKVYRRSSPAKLVLIKNLFIPSRSLFTRGRKYYAYERASRSQRWQKHCQIMDIQSSFSHARTSPSRSLDSKSKTPFPLSLIVERYDKVPGENNASGVSTGASSRSRLNDTVPPGRHNIKSQVLTKTCELRLRRRLARSLVSLSRMETTKPPRGTD
jgi:hypothetical protein